MAESTRGSFGSYLDEDILRQIEIRQNLQGRQAGYSVESYRALYSNTPWVCLRSSVDTPVRSWAPRSDSVQTSNIEARKYILCGGTLECSDDGKLAFSNGPTLLNGKPMPGYTKDSQMGYRPKPGITKVTVKTKDTYGCILEATVDFMVYSIDDLEKMDRIYFKPGMSALLEWGHTVYNDNSGKLHYMTAGDLFSMDRFFGNEDFETIQQGVQDWRRSIQDSNDGQSGFCGNYECLFGYITNFSYSFNQNGSYSCTLKIYSKGTILEGLQIPANAGCMGKPALKSEEKENDTTIDEDSSIKTPFHRIFNEALSRAPGIFEVLYSIGFEFGDWDSGVSEFYEFYGRHLYGWIRWNRLPETQPVLYITLNTFLKIVNRILKEANVDFIEFALKDSPGYVNMPYVSFKEHFSLDPGIVVLPTKAEVSGEDYNTVPALEEDLTVNKVLSTTNIGINTGAAGNNTIADLLINTDYILRVLDGIIDTETSRYNVKELVEGVLEGVQKAMGNINSFDIQINEVTNKAEIVDRNCVPGDSANQNRDLPIIVSGPKTTVTNLSVKSEVSAEMADSMAIAATAPNDGMSIADIDQVFWNEGCEDRHRLKKETKRQWRSTLDSTGIPNHLDVTESALAEANNRYQLQRKKKPFVESKDFLEQVNHLYSMFNGFRRDDQERQLFEDDDKITFSQYTESKYKNLILDGETLFKRCVNRDAEDPKETGSYLQSGLIPIKVGFTMKGIARFIIGTTFRISENLIPKKYKYWRHLITGVEHVIDKSGWMTTVESLYYPVVKKSAPGSVGVPVLDASNISTDINTYLDGTSYRPSSTEVPSRSIPGEDGWVDLSTGVTGTTGGTTVTQPTQPTEEGMLSRYISKAQFEYTRTKAYQKENKLTGTNLQNATEFCQRVLDRVCDELYFQFPNGMNGKNFYFTSAYRCPALNNSPSVKGASASQHMYGAAADCHFGDDNAGNKILLKTLLDLMEDTANPIPISQVILYPTSSRRIGFIHIGYNKPGAGGSGSKYHNILESLGNGHYKTLSASYPTKTSYTKQEILNMYTPSKVNYPNTKADTERRKKERREQWEQDRWWNN